MTFGERVIEFNKNLDFKGELPETYAAINPFRENEVIEWTKEEEAIRARDTVWIMKAFYKKVYNNNRKRVMILGKNPGLYGVGDTGVPFTDTKHLRFLFDVQPRSIVETTKASEFFYEMIIAYGGVREFYRNFYVGCVCPIGLKKESILGTKHWLNCDYYDRPTIRTEAFREGKKKWTLSRPLADKDSNRLFDALEDFIVESLKKQIAFGIDTRLCFVIGDDNAKWLKKINKEAKLFGKIIELHQPRFIGNHGDRKWSINRYLEILNGDYIV